MAALDEPDTLCRIRAGNPQDRLDPWTGSVDERSCARAAFAASAAEGKAPDAALAPRAYELRARKHARAERARVEDIEDDKTRVVDLAVGIDEAAREFVAKRRALGSALKMERSARRQQLAPAEMII